MKRVTGMDWLKKGIASLDVNNPQYAVEIDEILKIKPDVFNNFNEWTPLKLILLNYTFYVCSTIISKTSFFKHKYYVDFFAGSGINKLKGKQDLIIGSPLIVSRGNHSALYDEMIFCEKDPILSEALSLRLNFLKKRNLTVIGREYESCLDEIMKKLNQRDTYSFLFIDPDCMEFKWEDMKKVLATRSDILFNFMTTEMWRCVGLANAGKSEGKKLIDMFGDESWKKAKTEEEFVEIYKNKILEERKDAPVKVIKVQSKKFHFYYHLFFVTNKTSGGNKWLRAIDKAKEEIEANSDKAVMMALDVVKKRQRDLSEFWNR
jgi:three-Cys-motif partner protein